MANQYTVYQLHIHSEPGIPFFSTSASPEVDDVCIRFGETPKLLPDIRGQGALYQASPDHYLLHIPQVASYYATNGNQVIVQPAPASSDADISCFLLNPVSGALLYQRGLCLLHASAIASPQGAILFSGLSGSGKSTLAAVFLQRGYPVLADEICAIRLTPQGPCELIPAFPGLFLWKDVATKLNLAPRLTTIRQNIDKYYLNVAGNFQPETMPVYAIYHLQMSTSLNPRIRALKGLRAFELGMSNLYQPRLAASLGVQKIQYDGITALVQSAETFQLLRPEKWEDIAALADFIKVS